HGTNGRRQWENSTPCLAIAMSRRMWIHRCGTASCRAVVTPSRPPWVAAAARVATQRRAHTVSGAGLRTAATHGTAPVTASPAARWRSGSPHSPHTYLRERDEEL